MNDPQDTKAAPRRKLTVVEQAFCGWPLVLIFIGGAIGGLCGGAAWALNTRIMSGPQSAAVRYLLVVLTGFGAFALWFAVVTVLALLFPNLFAR